MTEAELRESLALWEKRLDTRKAKVDYWTAKVQEAEALIKRRKVQIARHEAAAQQAKPKFITAAQMGLTFTALFGELGPETYITGHYTAGPLDRDDNHGVQLARSVHEYHKSKGWGGAGYHLMILRSGTILGLRPTRLKGAHVGGANTGNLGIVVNGTTGDKPTDAQIASYKWIINNAHTEAMPVGHRTDRDLRNATRRGHKDWPGHTTNGCPGDFRPMYLMNLPGTQARAMVSPEEQPTYPAPTKIDGIEVNWRNVAPEDLV